MRPEEVLRVDFSTQARGFNQEEVRDHLEHVALALRDAQEQAVTANTTAHDLMNDLQRVQEQLRAAEAQGLDAGLPSDSPEVGTAVQDSETKAALSEAIAHTASLTKRLQEAEHALAEANARAMKAEQRALQAEQLAAEAVESEQLLKRTLVMAQRTADAAIAEAKAEANTLRTDAQARSTEVREAADTYAKTVRRDAEDHAARVTREADEAAKQTLEAAKAAAEKLTGEAQRDADQTLVKAADDAATMRALAMKIHDEVTGQAKQIAELRRTYAAQARAAIEDHVAAFSNLASLPDLPEALAHQVDSVRALFDREESQRAHTTAGSGEDHGTDGEPGGPSTAQDGTESH